jgi:hypothetical protein
MPDLGMFGICDLRAFSREYPQIPKPAAPPPPVPPLHRTPVTRDLKKYLMSYQCVPEDPPPRRCPGHALLAAGRANAGQHLSPTRRRRKASSNSLPAFWAESNRSVPQDGIRLASRSPRAPSFQAQRASTGLDDRVNKFVTFHPTGKRGSWRAPRPLRAGTSRRAMRSIRGLA